MDNSKKEAIKLIDRLYKDLYKSDTVIHHGNGNVYDKFNNIASYIDKLENIHSIGKHVKYLKSCYYDKYVIKREDIPKSYYDKRLKLMFERGLGYVELTDKIKKELQDEIIENQQSRLDTWIDYLLSEDSKSYPFWTKYWAFQGMLELGKYDIEKEIFNKRTKETMEPFVYLNREALAISIDMILKLVNKEDIEDNELNNLVKSGSFKKIYSHILIKLFKERKKIVKRNIGIWIKYNKGSNYMSLVNSLQGYNTEWCTVGESTAKSQLSLGDFYVYYTLDENNEYKIPRIAISMEDNKIVEIRGVAKQQNLEPEMEQVVSEKIKEFPDSKEYYKKVNDMKELTAIYNKFKSAQKLSKEELRFLYEIDSKIKGFGYYEDPRIKEIKQLRDAKKDLSEVFDCKEDQIALKKEEINEDTIYYRGSLDLGGTTSAEGLVLPQSIHGYLYLGDLKSAEGLVLPQSIGGYLNLGGLKNAEGLVLPRKIGEYLDLSGLISAKGVVLPQIIGEGLALSRLISTEGLVLPQIIGGYLDLGSLESVEGLVLPQNIGGGLYLRSLKNANGLIFPQSIGGYLDLSGLTEAENLVLPQNIGGDLDLNSLIRVENLVLPHKINGDLYLESLTSIEGLIMPESLTYTIHMNEFVITPENVNEYNSNKKIK